MTIQLDKIALSAVLGLFLSTSFAQAGSERLSVPRYKTLSVETVYPYSIQTYTPPWSVSTTVARAQARYDTPEACLEAYFSSMAAFDYSWNNQAWDSKSLAQMALGDRRDGMTPDKWIALWRENFAGRAFELLTKITYGKYVLIEYQRLPLAKGEPAAVETMALVLENKEWKLTQALASDPLLSHWKAPTGRVQVAPDALFEK